VAARPAFHPGTLFQNETRVDEAGLRRSFHREPLGSGLKPARGTFAVNPAHFRWDLRLACRLLFDGVRRRTAMGWLDAHESYLMEIIARDRVDELRSTVEIAAARSEFPAAPAAVVPDARQWSTASVALCPCALAKATR